MAAKKDPNCKILMVMNGPPWSTWTMSGVSNGVCSALLEKGLLYGAVSHRCMSENDFSKASIFYPLRERLQQLKNRLLGENPQPWRSETRSGLSCILEKLPFPTAVIYTYVNPEYGDFENIRRFRWIGISVLDAAHHNAYGHAYIEDDVLKEKFESQKDTIDQCEGIFTHSSYGADSIARDFNYPRDKIYPIGAGASVQSKGLKSTDIERYATANVLFIGRDWERKGGPLAYQAFLLLKKKIPHATLTIVGPTVQPVFGDGIVFEGFLRKHKYFERRRLTTLYSNASLFCTPSVCETWGLVYVEAAASGLPIVGTDEWAMPDIVLSGTTGILCQDRNPESLSSAMFEILSKPSEAKIMGEAAIKHVDEVLDWPNVADRIIAAISPEALEGRQPKWLPNDIDRSNMHQVK